MSIKTNFSEFVDYMKAQGWHILMDEVCFLHSPDFIFREERIKENQNTHCKIIAFRFVDAIENSTDILWEN